MKKNSTQNLQQMELATINRENVSRGPRKEVLNTLRQFARVYMPLKNSAIPGVILN